MIELNMIYVDDKLDTSISEYLKGYKHPKIELVYKEKKFNINEGYEALIRDEHVIKSNIIIIDSKLFENDQIVGVKFTGEEFKCILKKYYPFIQVIVISQNNTDKEMQIIQKYDSRIHGDKALKHYSGVLDTVIERCIEDIEMYRRIAEKIETNNSFEIVMVEKIKNSLNGLAKYDELTKADIDKLITCFKSLEEG